jgi:RND family efflux transporter MFP subunit
MTYRTEVRMLPRLFGGLKETDARALALAALFFSVAVAAGCSSHAEAADEQPATATAVRVRAALAVERPAVVNASGTVDANMTADVAFQVSGRIVRVAVEEGQAVKAGQLLAAIDPTDYQLSMQQATASAEQSKAEFERMRDLFQRGSLAPNDFQKFEAATKVAAANAALAAERLGHTRLVAPISGVIARRAIDLGEMAAPGNPVFTIVAVDPVTIRVGIPESQIGLIRRNASARIVVAAMAGQPFAARVTTIGVSADPASRTYPVKIDIPNPGRALLPGMIAEAQINGNRMTRALTIPGEAVVRDAEGATLVFVYFPAEQRVYSRRVTVGAPIDREIEITGGIGPNELVVIAGQERIRDGATVAATMEGAPSDSAKTVAQASTPVESSR